MSAEGDVHVPVPDEFVKSSAHISKRTKIPLLTNPLTGDSLLQMTTPLPTLPFEMITEILLRLPPKFLMQLRCVCKPWNSLISDRKFARKHLRMSTMNPNLIIKPNKYSPEFSHMVYPLRSFFTNVTTDRTQIQYPLNSYKFGSIVASCDGVVLTSTVSSCCLTAKYKYNSILWNPSIRKYNTLPCLETPLYHAITFGFGYDCFTDNYKVVAVFAYYCGSSSEYKTELKVHTLGTNSWRLLIDEFPYGSGYSDVFRFKSSGIFVSGTLNWLVCSDDSMTVCYMIVSLDLGTESYQEILQPDYGEECVEMVNSSTLVVLRDCLCLLRGQDIWLMKEYGNRESWTKFATVPHLGSYILSDVLYISEDDQVLLRLMTSSNFKFVVYDSRNGTLKSPDVKTIDGLVLPLIYVESLISPSS